MSDTNKQKITQIRIGKILSENIFESRLEKTQVIDLLKKFRSDILSYKVNHVKNYYEENTVFEIDQNSNKKNYVSDNSFTYSVKKNNLDLQIASLSVNKGNIEIPIHKDYDFEQLHQQIEFSLKDNIQINVIQTQDTDVFSVVFILDKQELVQDIVTKI
tara:strand:+ start:626 stop:1102 length:477 start_codon:yes stop_codon:yes gene_type:complete